MPPIPSSCVRSSLFKFSINSVVALTDVNDSVWLAFEGASIDIRDSSSAHLLKHFKALGSKDNCSNASESPENNVQAEICALAHQQSLVWVSFSDGSLRAFCSSSARLIRSVRLPSQRGYAIRTIACSEKHIWTLSDSLVLIQRNSKGRVVNRRKLSSARHERAPTLTIVHRTLWLASERGIEVWSLKGNFVTVMESESGSAVSSIVEVKGKGTAWAAGEDGILSVWDTSTMICLGELNQHKYPIVHLRSSSDRVISIDRSGFVCVWNGSSAALIASWTHDSPISNALAFNNRLWLVNTNFAGQQHSLHVLELDLNYSAEDASSFSGTASLSKIAAGTDADLRSIPDETIIYSHESDYGSAVAVEDSEESEEISECSDANEANDDMVKNSPRPVSVNVVEEKRRETNDSRQNSVAEAQIESLISMLQSSESQKKSLLDMLTSEREVWMKASVNYQRELSEQISSSSYKLNDVRNDFEQQLKEARDKASAQLSGIQILQENLEKTKREAESAKNTAEETITAQLEEKYRERLVVAEQELGMMRQALDLLQIKYKESEEKRKHLDATLQETKQVYEEANFKAEDNCRILSEKLHSTMKIVRLLREQRKRENEEARVKLSNKRADVDRLHECIAGLEGNLLRERDQAVDRVSRLKSRARQRESRLNNTISVLEKDLVYAGIAGERFQTIQTELLDVRREKLDLLKRLAQAERTQARLKDAVFDCKRLHRPILEKAQRQKERRRLTRSLSPTPSDRRRPRRDWQLNQQVPGSTLEDSRANGTSTEPELNQQLVDTL